MREQNDDVLYSTRVLRLITSDMLKGDPVPMMALVDWLIDEKGHTLGRLLRFAKRNLHLEIDDMLETIRALYGVIPSENFEIVVH